MERFKDKDFKKSSFSWVKSMCVSVAIGKRSVAVRDTKDRKKTTLHFNKAEWRAFVKGAKNGEFDI